MPANGLKSRCYCKTPPSMPLTEVMGTSSIAFRMDREMGSFGSGHGHKSIPPQNRLKVE